MKAGKDLKEGQVVMSISGRDKGRIFLVYEVIDARTVRVVNGKLRGVEKAKLKNTKHLMAYGDVIDNFYDDTIPASMNNKKIRDLIKPYEEKRR